jgi:acetoin utilization deacetylase AcuC-like enzyme
MTTAFITHDACLLHEMGADHPEQPARLKKIQEQLISSGLNKKLQDYNAPKASISQIKQVHKSAYVDLLFNKSPVDGLCYIDSDTAMNPYTLNAAQHAVGAVIYAVDLVMSGQHEQAFCSVRPPGHHAERKRGMGFCFFNNIAVGAMHALTKYDLTRIAIIDFDVHHGNGTEDIFQDEHRIFFCSSFQHPFYPYKGDQATPEHIHNIPLSRDTSNTQFREKIEQQCLLPLRQFKPQLVMISAGFDAHEKDDASNLNLHEDDYQWLTKKLREIAREYAQGRIISTLEGGYNLDALACSVQAHIEELI